MSLPLVGFGLGFLLAAQVGPVTLLIVRTVLRGGHAVAVGLAMACAVAFIDVVYGALGLSGVGQLLRTGAAGVGLGLLSAAVLVGIGARTLWRGLRARGEAEADEEVATPGTAFGTGVAATALNPLTIALWTVSFPASAPHAAANSTADALAVLCGVAAGTLAWYCSFALVLAFARRHIGAHIVAAVDVLVGAGLVLFGALLGYRALAKESDV